MIFDHDRQAKPHTTLIHLLFFVNFWDKFVIYSIILNPATSYRHLKRCQIWTPNCCSHTILTLNCSELPLLLFFFLSICPPFSDCFSHCLSTVSLIKFVKLSGLRDSSVFYTLYSTLIKGQSYKMGNSRRWYWSTDLNCESTRGPLFKTWQGVLNSLESKLRDLKKYYPFLPILLPLLIPTPALVTVHCFYIFVSIPGTISIPPLFQPSSTV